MNTLRPADRVAVLTFDLRPAPPFGSETRDVDRAMATASASGGTALFDAILVALSELQRDRRHRGGNYRDAIVVLTDGEDTASRLSFDDVREAVRRSHVLVYAISLRANREGRWLPPPYTLTAFTVDTGGRAFTVAAPELLASRYRQSAKELRHLYRLG